MDMYPDVMRKQIDDLNKNLENLNNQIKESSKSSEKLQERLVFWTKIMAGAIIIQVIAIGVQIYLSLS
ncbi:MAG: hypothetical protein Q7S55_02655 [Nanoarchaeota archaeon]|nr:hypothetical protein [Nanoarchaeota archaeon]